MSFIQSILFILSNLQFVGRVKIDTENKEVLLATAAVPKLASPNPSRKITLSPNLAQGLSA